MGEGPAWVVNTLECIPFAFVIVMMASLSLMSDDGIHDVVYMLYSMAVSSLVWTVPSRASDPAH